jgi:hypothetical protein
MENHTAKGMTGINSGSARATGTRCGHSCVGLEVEEDSIVHDDGDVGGQPKAGLITQDT